MYIHIYMYTYCYVCLYIYININIFIYRYIYVHRSVHMCIVTSCSFFKSSKSYCMASFKQLVHLNPYSVPPIRYIS